MLILHCFIIADVVSDTELHHLLKNNVLTCSAEHMLFMGSTDYPDENEVV